MIHQYIQFLSSKIFKNEIKIRKLENKNKEIIGLTYLEHELLMNEDKIKQIEISNKILQRKHDNLYKIYLEVLKNAKKII